MAKSFIQVDGITILSPDAPHGRMERRQALAQGRVRNISSKGLSDEELIDEVNEVLKEEYSIFAPKVNENELLCLVGRLKKISTRKVLGKNKDFLAEIFPMPEPVSPFCRNGFYREEVARAQAAQKGVDSLRKYFETKKDDIFFGLKATTGYDSFDEFLEGEFATEEISYVRPAGE